MINNSSKILFLMMMMTGTLITITSNSWLSAWMGLEINLLSFIPIMSDNNNLTSTESSLKYFLTQALASSVLLFSIILLMLKNSSNIDFSQSNISMIMISALLLKTGAAPFHFWFPNMMEGLTWMNALLLMTWQKIAPLLMITYLKFTKFLIVSVVLSVLVGALGGLNQSSIRKLMAFSSINHLGWMISSISSSESILVTYFMFYSFLSMTLIIIFNTFKISHMNQLFSLHFNSKILKFTLFMNFLSLGGLPPFLGFLPKWIIIQYLSFNSQYLLLMILLSCTLITLFFYLRMCYSAFMLNYYENNWMNFSLSMNFYTKIYTIMSFVSIFGLSMISMIYFTF
uniref:NADH-ubiquinone oxidoreductase chain 2 n=1 Tax=Paraleucophenga shanyinensis TaxID=498763 RepID=C0ILQ8_9MUSC|nr:NADH dehydrogenase subunit 2 [Paraleucophenga shanyinensis]